MTSKTGPKTPTPQTAAPTLTLERVFDASPERLWSYWTDPVKYARWFNPAPHHLVVHEFDVRPGGRIRFDMPQPDGNPNPQSGVFHVVDPPRELVSGEPDKSFLVRVLFQPVAGGKTRLVVEVTGLPPEYRDPATQGWNAIFDKLAAEVVGGTAAPAPTPASAPAASTASAAAPAGKTVAKVVGRSVHLERFFRAPPAKVWAAWTTPATVERWFWPVGQGQLREFDLRVGGRIVMAHREQPWVATWEFVEIVPQRKIVIHDHWDDGSGHKATGTIEFRPEAGGTRLVVTHGPFPEGGPYRVEDAAAGFSVVMERLAGLVEMADAPQGEGFTIERTLQAPPEKVWRMWTTKEGLEKWFRPDGYTTKVRTLDVRVGGEYALEMTSKEHTAVNHGTYTEVVPHRRLAMRWEFDIFLGPEDRPYPVPITVDLQPVAGGTKMTFTQGPLAKPEFTEGSRQGVQSNFEKLAAALAT